MTYEYVHVGRTLHDEECHLAFCLFHPNLKLAIGCNYFPKNWSWITKGGAAMANVLVRT
jgi:hypothetical protein